VEKIHEYRLREEQQSPEKTNGSKNSVKILALHFIPRASNITVSSQVELHLFLM
jgi:hypothetical protein